MTHFAPSGPTERCDYNVNYIIPGFVDDTGHNYGNSVIVVGFYHTHPKSDLPSDAD